jgi:hypothetical protein
MNDTNDELEAQIRAALARKRQQQQAQQPAKPAAPPPQPVIVSSGMVRNPVAGQPGAAAPRPAASAQRAPQPVAQPTAHPATQPHAPAPAAQPALQPSPAPSARPSAPGMVLDPSERLGVPAAAQPSQPPLQQLGPRFATPEAAVTHAAAATVARQQPNPAPPAAPAPSTEDGRRALGALLARSAQQANAGDTQIPPPPGQVLGRIGVEQQPAPAPKEKPFRHPFFSGKRHLWPMLVIPAVSIGVVLVLFYFLIFELGGEGVVDIAPLIEAEQTPLKVRPDDEGGMEEPQDREIYSEIDGATTPDPSAEQLVPAPEQPVIPATPEATEAAVPTVPVVEAPSVDAGAEAATATEATEPVTADGAAATEAATTEGAAVTEPATEATPTTEATEPTAEATEAAQPEPVTQEAALPPGSYRVQLAAVRSEDGARATWQELQAKLPELASLQLHIERIDLGSNGIYYRVQGGPLPDKGAASTLCSRLGSRGQDCLVVNP